MSKRIVASIHVVILFFALLVNACISSPNEKIKIEKPGLPATLAVQTMAARPELEELVSTAKPQEFHNPLGFSSVSTGIQDAISFPTITPTITPLHRPTQPSESVNGGDDRCFNAAEFIKDVSIPDNTQLNRNQKFSKVWELKNVGTCTWTPEYALIFVWGNQMSGPSTQSLKFTVEPGALVDISVDLITPSSPGSYQGDWMLIDNNGNKFGTGYKARDHFWVAINTKSPGLSGLIIRGGC